MTDSVEPPESPAEVELTLRVLRKRVGADLAGRCRAGSRWRGRCVIRDHLAAELLVEGERLPVFFWTIDHPAGLALVDTGWSTQGPRSTI